MIHSFQCVTLLADGRTVSSVEVYDTAFEAMARASAWRAVGDLAYAQVVVIDLTSLVVDRIRLD